VSIAPGNISRPPFAGGPVVPAPPASLICLLARISILIPAGRGHGVVLGRGSTGSAIGREEGGCRKCLMMAINWKSTTIGTAFVGDIAFDGKLGEQGGESEDVSRDD